MKQKLKVIFSKTGDMRFVSHLDLVRLFQRSSRRAAIPLTMTQGFSPHLKISIKNALKLGLESESQEAVFYMDERMGPEDFLKSINEKLPDGIRMIRAEEII